MGSQIRVAVIGGGVAGATVMRGLLQYPHIDAHIFESAPAFKEAGIAFGLARNATQALSLIDPSAIQCLERAGGVPMQGVKFFVAQGEEAGAPVFQQTNQEIGKPTTTIVQRANFLRELLADVPKERMHVSKKLEKIERRDDGSILIHFTDRSTRECDILIGADGIRSTVRKIILGDDDIAAKPKNTGWWCIQTLQPYEKARNSIGKGPIDIENAREYGWFGDGAMMMSNILGNGTLVQFVVAGKHSDAEGTDEIQRPVTAEELKATFVGTRWLPHLEKAVKDLLCQSPSQPAYYLREHPPARTFVDGPLCIIGDAAHSTTPWQGSGGGLSIEDSMLLSNLLGRAKSPAEGLVALEVYDEIRRPRTQRVVESSHRTGEIVTGKYEGVGLDAEKLRGLLEGNWDHILDYDNEKHRDEAVGVMEGRVAKIRG